MATTIERNISQISSRLDATNSNIMSMATTVERNISSLFLQLDVVSTHEAAHIIQVLYRVI
jgi:hypothetical protein